MAIMSIDESSPTVLFPVRGRSLSHWSWQRRAP
jgi:hypothetical protein